MLYDAIKVFRHAEERSSERVSKHLPRRRIHTGGIWYTTEPGNPAFALSVERWAGERRAGCVALRPPYIDSNKP